MTKDDAIKELVKLQKFWKSESKLAEADGNSNFSIFSGAIGGVDVAIEIIKEID
jgi:hypothetical protein